MKERGEGKKRDREKLDGESEEGGSQIVKKRIEGVIIDGFTKRREAESEREKNSGRKRMKYMFQYLKTMEGGKKGERKREREREEIVGGMKTSESHIYTLKT